MRTPSPRRPGFTLIELMISIALAVVIILVAVQAFSAITKTIAGINRLNQENQLLRAGFWAVMQNVDYWDSDASPDAPYFRLHHRHARARVANPGAGTLPENNGSWDLRKRPFAPVVFSSETDGTSFLDRQAANITVTAKNPDGGTPDAAAFLPIQNPSVFLPHDPRSWYRNGHFGSAISGQVSFTNSGNPVVYSPYISKSAQFGGWISGLSPSLLLGDYGLHQATDMGGIGSADRFRPVDWDGSWGVDEDADGFSDNDPSDDLIVDLAQFDASLDPVSALTLSLAQTSRPRAFWQIFQRLGHYGTSLYMPPGMPYLIVDQFGSWPRNDCQPTFLGKRSDGTWRLDAMQSFNAYASVHDAGRSAPIQTSNDLLVACGGGGRDWHTYLAAGSGGYGCAAMLIRPTRYPEYTSMFFDWGGSPTKRSRFGKDMYYLYAPFRGRSDTESLFGDCENFSNGGGVIKVARHPTFTSETVLLPFNITDQWKEAVVDSDAWRTDTNDPIKAYDQDDLAKELKNKGLATDATTLRSSLRVLDLNSKPADAPLLKMQLLRLQLFDGAQACIGHVVLENPETGVSTFLRLCPLGTSYRGARQHWASRHLLAGGTATSNDNAGNGPIGDFYAY